MYFPLFYHLLIPDSYLEIRKKIMDWSHRKRKLYDEKKKKYSYELLKRREAIREGTTKSHLVQLDSGCPRHHHYLQSLKEKDLGTESNGETTGKDLQHAENMKEESTLFFF